MNSERDAQSGLSDLLQIPVFTVHCSPFTVHHFHGHLVPYIVPTANYLKYIKEKHVKRVIDAGIDAIFMEEPEFWARGGYRGGYSEAFKQEWKNYYGFDWRPQHESPENTYLSNKLKYRLYYHALDEVFTYAKEYGKSKGMDVKCYVPTHSLVNYSQWMIVSPEACLASLPFLKRGVPVSIVHIENLAYKGALKDTKVLLMSYSNMKPLSAESHSYIAQWVKNKQKPISVLINNKEDRSDASWDERSKTYLLTFENNPEGVSVVIRW